MSDTDMRSRDLFSVAWIGVAIANLRFYVVNFLFEVYVQVAS